MLNTWETNGRLAGETVETASNAVSHLVFSTAMKTIRTEKPETRLSWKNPAEGEMATV